MYYMFIVISTVLFAGQFVLSKEFQKLNGSSLQTALRFSAQTSIVSFCVMLFLAGFHIDFSAFSLFWAFTNSCITVSCSYCGIKALKTANLSVYSVFNMLGGMLLPFLYGIFSFGEIFTIGKLLCCVLIGVSLVLSMEDSKENNGAVKYYAACFILNGLVGVVAKIHQSHEAAVNSPSFMAMSSIFTFVISSVLLITRAKKPSRINKRDFKFTISYAICNGIGNLLLLIALKYVDASVQYPLVTGGVIVFSAIASYLQKNKMRLQSILAVIAAFLATVFVIL